MENHIWTYKKTHSSSSYYNCDTRLPFTILITIIPHELLERKILMALLMVWLLLGFSKKKPRSRCLTILSSSTLTSTVHPPCDQHNTMNITLLSHHLSHAEILHAHPSLFTWATNLIANHIHHKRTIKGNDIHLCASTNGRHANIVIWEVLGMFSIALLSDKYMTHASVSSCSPFIYFGMSFFTIVLMVVRLITPAIIEK